MKKTTAIELDQIIKDFMQLEHVRPLNKYVQECIETRLLGSVPMLLKLCVELSEVNMCV